MAGKQTNTGVSTGAGAAAGQPGDVVLEARRELRLDCREAHWVSWSPLEPLVRPEPEPFDRERCLKRLSKLRIKRGDIDWNHPSAKIAEVLSPEESRFWFDVISWPGHEQRPERLAKLFADRDFSEPLTPYAAEQAIRLRVARRTLPGPFMLPLANSLTPLEIVELLLDDSLINTGKLWLRFAADISVQALESFRRYVMPYLLKHEREEIRERVESELSSAVWPSDALERPNTAFHLAAFVGHPRILHVVSAWDDHVYRGERIDDFYHQPQWMVFGLPSAEQVNYHMRRLQLKLRAPEHVRGWLATTQFAGLDYAAEAIAQETSKDRAAELAETWAAAVQAPEAAEPMLRLVLDSKAPGVARAWLSQHVGCGIAGLIATAAARGKLAEAAVEYLREQNRRGFAEIIAQQLELLPAEAADKVRRAVLEHHETVFEPLEEASTPDWLSRAMDRDASAKKRIKLPDWLPPDSLPPIVIDSHRLNGAQVRRVLAALRADAFVAPGDLLAGLREHAAAASLDAFAWRLFERWQEQGSPAKDKWCLGAIGFFGGDASVLKLTPLIRAWPGESQHQRAVYGLECLRAIGTDTALMQLNGIAQKLKFKGLKEKAQAFMKQIADEQGLSPAQLADRIVPDCGLDARGSRVFDFGPRRFQFVFGPDLKPMVRDDDGKLRGDLPKPGAKDAAALSTTAVAEWKLLKKQLREAVKAQIPRLEQAMVVSRRWTVKEFETLLARHPLMTHLIRPLLWGAFNARGLLENTFRLTAELDYADRHDEPCAIESSDRIGLVHPAYLNAEEIAAWAEIFSDYELVPPFEQLRRRVYALEPEEERQRGITRFGHLQLPANTMLGILERLGWTRGQPEDAGVVHQHSKSFQHAELTAVLEYEPGVPIGYVENWHHQQPVDCYFLPAQVHSDWYGRLREKAILLREVDAVVVSEVLRDLHVLAAKAIR